MFIVDSVAVLLGVGLVMEFGIACMAVTMPSATHASMFTVGKIGPSDIVVTEWSVCWMGTSAVAACFERFEYGSLMLLRRLLFEGQIRVISGDRELNTSPVTTQSLFCG